MSKLGFDTAVRLYGAYTEAIDLIEKLVTEEGIDCDFARTGKLTLASKAAHYQGFEKTHELLNARLGLETQLVPKAELRREMGRTPSTAQWWSRGAPVSTWASTSGDLATQPSAPA